MNTSPVNRFERRKQRTRDQLKQAAIGLILEKGYDAVQVQDITDRADLGRGTFYIHFADKEDVVWRAVRVFPPPAFRRVISIRTARSRLIPVKPESSADWRRRPIPRSDRGVLPQRVTAIRGRGPCRRGLPRYQP